MRATVFTLVLAVAGLCVGGREAYSAKGPIADPTPPDFKELLQIVLRQQNLKLGAAVHHEGCVASETLGDYLAMLIVNGSQGEVHSLTGACATYDPARSQLHPPRMFDMFWECHVRASSGDKNGASPWRYELSVLVDQSTRKMDPKTLACPGGG